MKRLIVSSILAIACMQSATANLPSFGTIVTQEWTEWRVSHTSSIAGFTTCYYTRQLIDNRTGQVVKTEKGKAPATFSGFWNNNRQTCPTKPTMPATW